MAPRVQPFWRMMLYCSWIRMPVSRRRTSSLVGQFLELDEFDLPRTVLLGENRLEGHGGIAVSATRVMEKNVYFFHHWNVTLRLVFGKRSKRHAMWITPGSYLCSMSSMGTFTQISRPLHGLFICFRENGFMRCDLHVHSTASGMCSTPGLGPGVPGIVQRTGKRCTTRAKAAGDVHGHDYGSRLD